MRQEASPESKRLNPVHTHSPKNCREYLRICAIPEKCPKCASAQKVCWNPAVSMSGLLFRETGTTLVSLKVISKIGRNPDQRLDNKTPSSVAGWGIFL